jgi:ABC-type nitrate/sulfonate/bicarbonate transport system permease component
LRAPTHRRPRHPRSVGLRLGLAQAWRILIAVEMLMSVKRGLGWLIFGAQTFLNTDVMLATIAVIGAIGILCFCLVAQTKEARPVPARAGNDARNL